MEHLPDDSPRYYGRHNSADLIDAFEDIFIGKTLLRACDFLADTQDIDPQDLLDLRQPLSTSIERPDVDGVHEYSFSVMLASELGQENNDPTQPFAFVLTHNQTTAMPISLLTEMQKTNLTEQINAMEEPDEDLLTLLNPKASLELQQAVKCQQQICTTYTCSQSDNTIAKTVAAHYYVGNMLIASVGFDMEGDDELPEDQEQLEAVDEDDLTVNQHLLFDIGSTLGIIQPADMADLYEILYYLRLPGGTIATDVTVDYQDDPRVVA